MPDVVLESGSRNLNSQSDPSCKGIIPNVEEVFKEDFYRVYHKEFATILHLEVLDLCIMCSHLLIAHDEHPEEMLLNSGGVYRFVMECTRCEDLLDQVHADQQLEWAYIRKLVAVIKHSCSIAANLQYLSALTEKLTDSIEGNFPMANQFVLKSLYRMLRESAQNFLSEIWRLGVVEQNYELPQIFKKYFTQDISPLVRLKTNISLQQDHAKDGVDDVNLIQNQTVLHLLSNLLDHCDSIKYLNRLQNTNTNKRNQVMTDELHEESLAAQCELFHGMVTFFDTQSSQKQIIPNPEVVNLIDHVKVIYHLFTGLSTLMRIKERHYQFFVNRNIKFSLSGDEIEGIVFDFFISYIDRFRLQVEKMSKCLITRYSVQKKINLPIPCYRGFHVRPSTLVARIVIHYGSKVNMLLNDTAYDAAVPFDIFRANEVINAEKRREIGKIIVENKDCQNYAQRLRKNASYDQILTQKYFLELFESLQRQKKIVVYEPLSMDSLEKPSPEEDFFEYVKREIAYLIAMGKIDIASDLTVTFEGDSQVLADIGILAAHGYGEDQKGDNVPLPKELSYLRR